MFHGQSEQKVDSRGRLAVGSFGRLESREEMIVTLHPAENCLRIARQEDFEEDASFLLESRGGAEGLADAMDPDLDALRRKLFASASEARTDGQLRLTVDSELLEEIGVEPGDQVQVVGTGRYLEVWKPETWREYRDREDADGASLERALSRLREEASSAPEGGSGGTE